MDYFKIETDAGSSRKRRWCALSHDGEFGALGCLSGALPLAEIWKAPLVSLWQGKERPDVYRFEAHWAVVPRVRKLSEPLVGDEAEFLPLRIDGRGRVFVIHPLWPVALDRHAIFEPNEPGSNITCIEKYSFRWESSSENGPRQIFRVLQAPGSPARDIGANCSGLIVSEEIKEVVEKRGVTGILFEKVYSA